MPKLCPVCLRELEYPRTNQIYCDSYCRDKMYRIRLILASNPSITRLNRVIK